jgi:hypothetical protein
MTQSFTWVAWDVKQRGVRHETRVHNNWAINRRRKLQLKAGPRKDLEPSFEDGLVQSELTRVDAGPSVELGVSFNRETFETHYFVHRSMPLKHQSSASKIHSPPESTNVLTRLSKPGNTISAGSNFPHTNGSLKSAHVLRSGSHGNGGTKTARCAAFQSFPHRSHNTSLPSSRTSDLTNSAWEFEIGLQLHEDEALSPTSTATSYVPSPQDYLTSLRRDTLNALPVDLDQDQVLVDYWLAEMPRILHLDGSPSIARMLSSGPNLLFSAVLSCSEAFQSTILLWAMYHRAQAYGISYSPQAV